MLGAAAALLLLPAILTAIGQPAGRYSHCSVMYNNHMLVYGGRGFQQTKRTLTTLGCA